MRLTTLSPQMGQDIVATTPEEFDEQCAAKYKFVPTPRPTKPRQPLENKGGKFRQRNRHRDIIDSLPARTITGRILAKVSHVWDETQRVPVTKDTKILPLKTSCLEPYCPKGLVGRSSTPEETIEKPDYTNWEVSKGVISGLVVSRNITANPTLRQDFVQTREIEDTPQPWETVAISTRKQRSLRGFLKTKDIHVRTQQEARKYEMAWYAHGCPNQLTERSKPSEPMLPYEVMPTVYIRNFPRPPLSVKSDDDVWAFRHDFWLLERLLPKPRRDPTLYIKVFREKARNVTMHPSIAMFDRLPIGKYYTWKKGPQRESFEIDFLGLDVTTLSKKEKVWWAGEVYRVNYKKDGMRRASGRMYEVVAAFFGISTRTVKRSVLKDYPIECEDIRRTASKKGSGFKGISGDWVVGFQKKETKRWMLPWYIS